MPVLRIDNLINDRCAQIYNIHGDNNIPRAELDVSGGIDSAVMLMLLAKALGPENVTAVYSSINSSDESRSRAQLVAKAAGVPLIELDLTEIYEALVKEARVKLFQTGEAAYGVDAIQARIDEDPTILGSLRSTLRAPVGRFMNRITGGGIRHGTGNEDEDRWLRFYQKGGDGEVDTNPLAFLSKGEVYQLAVALGVPEEIITCMPTPDLWGSGEAHNDEAELSKLSGVEWTYSRVDPKTGKYMKVGTIERMSRFLDLLLLHEQGGVPRNPTYGDVLFGTSGLVDDGEALKLLYADAENHGLTREHCDSARKWERITRHKMNPNCPDLTDGLGRKALVEAGILTDELPEV